jgi:hypothetical protein
MRYIAILIAILFLSSCCNSKIYRSSYTSSRDTTTVITEELRYVDTVLKIDSSVTIVQYHCDSLSRVVVDTIYQPYASKRKSSVSNLGGGKFQFNCEADSLRVLLAAKDKTIDRMIRSSESREVVIEKRLGFMDRIKDYLFYIGWTICSMLAGVLLYIVLKSKFNIH